MMNKGNSREDLKHIRERAVRSQDPETEMLLRGPWETLRAHGRKTETQQHSEQKSQPENKVGRLWTAATAATAVCEAARGEGRSGSKRGPDLNPGRHRRLQGGRQGGWPCGTGAGRRRRGGRDRGQARESRGAARAGGRVSGECSCPGPGSTGRRAPGAPVSGGRAGRDDGTGERVGSGGSELAIQPLTDAVPRSIAASDVMPVLSPCGTQTELSPSHPLWNTGETEPCFSTDGTSEWERKAETADRR